MDPPLGDDQHHGEVAFLSPDARDQGGERARLCRQLQIGFILENPFRRFLRD
jgi:hypothetical protein